MWVLRLENEHHSLVLLPPDDLRQIEFLEQLVL